MRLLTISTFFTSVCGGGLRAERPRSHCRVGDRSLGAVLSSAPIQAKNVTTGTVYKAASTPSGSYTLGDLPAGTYDISVTIPGLKGYEHKAVAVAAGKTAALNIRLEEGTQLSTLGEDPLGHRS